jgi:hypothetical protein
MNTEDEGSSGQAGSIGPRAMGERAVIYAHLDFSTERRDGMQKRKMTGATRAINVEAQPATPIESAFEEMLVALGVARGELESLGDRLRPVTQPCAVEDAKIVGEDSSCQLEGRIKAAARGVRELAAGMRQLRESLCI